MRDYLKDLVEHTHDLGCIDLIKITGDDKSTAIVGVAEDLSVVLEGEFKNPHADFVGTFGMPNLNKLKILLNLPEYRENAKLKTPKFKGATWHIEFEPTVAAIQRLRMQAQANAEEPNFQAKTENGDLKFFFGDHSTHAGNFVFHSGVNGQLKRAWSWPAQQFMAIMALTGDKTVRISDDGAAKITVDSGVAVYNYILPAQSK